MKIFVTSLLIFFTAFTYGSIKIEILRDSYLYAESKNSQLFSINVILKQQSEIIFKEKLTRGNKFFLKDLEANQYTFLIEFNSALKGKIKNLYYLKFLDPGYYQISIGKKDNNFFSPLITNTGHIYAYGINNLIFTPSSSNKDLNKAPDNLSSLKSTLRNLSLLYEQEVITKDEYLDRRKKIISKISN